VLNSFLPSLTCTHLHIHRIPHSTTFAHASLVGWDILDRTHASETCRTAAGLRTTTGILPYRITSSLFVLAANESSDSEIVKRRDASLRFPRLSLILKSPMAEAKCIAGAYVHLEAVFQAIHCLCKEARLFQSPEPCAVARRTDLPI
jgi:hypothetical protein